MSAKLLFVWSGLTGYMGDCWRELTRRDGVELMVSVDLKNRHFGGQFDPNDVLRKLNWSDELPEGYRPDIVFVVGWRNALCRSAALREWGNGVRKILCFDMPWELTPRKLAARFCLWRYLRHFDATFIPGIATAPYARWLGFSADRIFTGLYATDTNRFGAHLGGKGFLYVGRDAPEKGLYELREAHQIYRAMGGRSPLRIVNGVSPNELGHIYAEADCFVLPSLWEPWGVVLAEAAAAGLPIICTDKCGARHEVVKGNGIVVKAGNAHALADAMLKVESGIVAINGEAGRALAQPYSCASWADRVFAMLKTLSV